MPGGPFVGSNQNYTTKDQVPKIHGGGENVRVVHKEYIQDITSTTGFSNTVFDINPGIAKTFPWLSSIAQCFEQYKFNGLMFQFVTTSVDALNSTNTALGEIIMVAEYNVNSPKFSNIQQMLNSMWAVSTKPSCNAIAPIECDPRKQAVELFYVRTGAVPSGQDQRFFDPANLQLATNGNPAASVNLGQLWVTYDISFQKPILQLDAGNDISSYMAYSATVASDANPMGTSQTELVNNIPVTLSTASKSVSLSVPPGIVGEWEVQYWCQGGTAQDPGTVTMTVTSNSALDTISNGPSIYPVTGAAPSYSIVPTSGTAIQVRGLVLQAIPGRLYITTEPVHDPHILHLRTNGRDGRHLPLLQRTPPNSQPKVHHHAEANQHYAQLLSFIDKLPDRLKFERLETKRMS